jgi:hypothetical protein
MVLEAANPKIGAITGSTMERRIDLNNKTKAPEQVSSTDDCLDVVVDWVEKIAGKNYFIAPLEEFQQRFGKVNPEDDFYQSRMNYFLEWCVLERPLSLNAAGRAPASIFFEKHPDITNLENPSSSSWRAFSGFRHSIFEVVEAGSDCIEVVDLCSGKLAKVVSKSGETLRYLSKGTIFQGYLFGHHAHRMLGQGLIIHPELAYKQIKRFLKDHQRLPRFSSAEICRFFAMTNMRYLRMQHVNPAVIYQSISS